MRKIDYWIGIPICFILTLINNTKKIVYKNNFLSKNILFIGLSEMGSNILAYPTIKEIKKRNSESRIYFLTFKKNRISIDILNIIPLQNVFTIRDDSLGLFVFDTVRVICKIRRRRIDTVLDLELFSRFSVMLSFLSAAPKRVGFYNYNMEGLYRGNLLTHKVQYNSQQHISKNFFCFSQIIHKDRWDVPTMQEEVDDTKLKLPKIKSLNEDREKIWYKLRRINKSIDSTKRLIIINPSVEKILSVREWPLEYFIKLTKLLLKNKNNYIIITGKKDASNKAKSICNSVNNKRCLNLTNNTSFSELVHLYNISDILITNDCGPAHFASLTPIKKYVFFGPETPVLYKPLGDNVEVLYSNFPCSPCLSAFNHRRTSCHDNRCLKVIKPIYIYNLIKSVIYRQQT